ncbi:hypothetical protein ID875_26890 [Streptomyces globisporus]|uniref:Uncharacterized protein n=1 Tax=Streptomyces globisporus TaxID=1908 RepID=A0A927GPT2_STRGL|nr:hypothetical protein [Streptomyces globisporus]
MKWVGKSLPREEIMSSPSGESSSERTSCQAEKSSPASRRTVTPDRLNTRSPNGTSPPLSAVRTAGSVCALRTPCRIAGSHSSSSATCAPRITVRVRSPLIRSPPNAGRRPGGPRVTTVPCGVASLNRSQPSVNTAVVRHG